MATHYRTATVDGVDVFYREDGPTGAPVVLLLPGFPSSSRIYRDLIPRLAGRYHVIAPDYPAFGHRGVPAGTSSPTRSTAWPGSPATCWPTSGSNASPSTPWTSAPRSGSAWS
jgi:pimeloyl-ACP methyl ester carboxylesterase